MSDIEGFKVGDWIKADLKFPKPWYVRIWHRIRASVGRPYVERPRNFRIVAVSNSDGDGPSSQ